MSHCSLSPRPSTVCVCVTTVLYLFFFSDTATPEIYTLSLHDALPIYTPSRLTFSFFWSNATKRRSISASFSSASLAHRDRKSTRLNSSHTVISYAVFCLKKKKKKVVAVANVIDTMNVHLSTVFL